MRDDFISAEELIRPLKDALLLNTDGFYLSDKQKRNCSD